MEIRALGRPQVAVSHEPDHVLGVQDCSQDPPGRPGAAAPMQESAPYWLVIWLAESAVQTEVSILETRAVPLGKKRPQYALRTEPMYEMGEHVVDQGPPVRQGGGGGKDHPVQ